MRECVDPRHANEAVERRRPEVAISAPVTAVWLAEICLQRTDHGGQSSTGPLWWRLVFFPRGNNASGWMSLYVQPQTIPIRNTRVQMAFASDCGTFMTSIKFCLEKQSDWGYRTWRKFPTDVVEHIDVAVSVVMIDQV
jgi:hypothetical protein